MAKIELDKYYTPVEVAEKLINTTYEVIGKENITDIIEPSAGNGSFSLLIDNCIAYDIEPEHPSIEKQDFLKLDIPYRKGRLIIGNPPFGRGMNLAQKFYKKSVDICDYIAFILPISQLNNNNSLYEFDLVYSEDLGEVVYTDRKLHCVFNVYKRPLQGLNKKPKNKLKDVTIIRQDSKGYEDKDFDIRMCYWGNGSGGKIIKDPHEKHSGEYKIVINNKELYDTIYKTIVEHDWVKEVKSIAMRRIKQYHIIEVLKSKIPNIE